MNKETPTTLSMTIKLLNLTSALEGISEDIEQGFSENEINEIVLAVQSLGIGESGEFDFNVQYMVTVGKIFIKLSIIDEKYIQMDFTSKLRDLINEIEGLLLTHYGSDYDEGEDKA